MSKSVALIVGVLVCALPSGAAAQQQQQQQTQPGQFLDGKLAITLTVGGQPGSQDANRTISYPLYQPPENARIETAHDIGGGFLFDIGGSYKVWQNLGIGMSYSRVSNKGGAAIAGQIPHPLFTNQPRNFTVTASDLDHVENTIHVQAIWFIPFTDKVEFSAFVGPSFFTVTQDFTSSIFNVNQHYTETEPFNSVTVNSVDIVGRKESSAGFNLGADASYAFTKTLSGIAMIRYSQASVDFDLGGGETVGLDAGNAQFGVGVRVKF